MNENIEPPTMRDGINAIFSTIKTLDAQYYLKQGRDFADKNEWRSALDNLTMAEDIFYDMRDRVMMANIISMKALCFFALGMIAESENALVRSAIIFESLGDKERAANDLLILGKVRLRLSKLEEAERSFRSAMRLFVEIGDDDGMRMAEEQLTAM